MFVRLGESGKGDECFYIQSRTDSVHVCHKCLIIQFKLFVVNVFISSSNWAITHATLIERLRV